MKDEQARALVWWIILIALLMFWTAIMYLAFPKLSNADDYNNNQYNPRWIGPQSNNERCCVIIEQEPIPRNKMEREMLRLNPNAKLFRTRRHDNDWRNCRGCR